MDTVLAGFALGVAVAAGFGPISVLALTSGLRHGFAPAFGVAVGVAFVKGTDFLLEGGENALRLAYSGVTVDQIDEGVARLAEAYRAQQKQATV